MLEVALRKRLGDFQLDAAFAAPGGLITLFGPSGSGKSLTLQTIAGTIEPDAGRIALDGQPIFDSSSSLNLPPKNAASDTCRSTTPCSRI